MDLIVLIECVQEVYCIATASAVRTFLITETVRLNFGKLSYRADSELVELHGEAQD
jgi:hypothetical protein